MTSISLAIKNLRKLHETPEIELKPLTILLGKNSAGKSTLLRSLPLIRQSIEKRSSAPILWHGDYVDFGDFKSAKQIESHSDDITFKFSIADTQLQTIRRFYSTLRMTSANISRIQNAETQFIISSTDDQTFLKSIIFRLSNDNEIQLDFDDDSLSNTIKAIYINQIALDLPPSIIFSYESSFLFSELRIEEKESIRHNQPRVHYTIYDAVFEHLEKLIRPHLPKTLGATTIKREIDRICCLTPPNKDNFRSLSSNTKTLAFKKIYKKVADTEELDFLLLFSKFTYLAAALEATNQHFHRYFTGVRYLGPARSGGQRYYRNQELQVGEIDPNGENLPFFLNSLSHDQASEFSNWVAELFGFGVSVSSEQGHVALNILSAEESPINVADTGYGISQVLPVLAMLWSATADYGVSPRINRKPTIIAVEQPELHLHPAHQAKLADIFTKLIRPRETQNPPLPHQSFLVETHSEAFINRLGQLIAEGAVDPRDVQILIFSTGPEVADESQIDIASYTEDGLLKGWPSGFFNY